MTVSALIPDCLDRHTILWLRPMKMADILPTHVREWVRELDDAGETPANIRQQKIICRRLRDCAQRLRDRCTRARA
jgi:hypothetical protein